MKQKKENNDISPLLTVLIRDLNELHNNSNSSLKNNIFFFIHSKKIKNNERVHKPLMLRRKEKKRVDRVNSDIK